MREGKREYSRIKGQSGESQSTAWVCGYLLPYGEADGEALLNPGDPGTPRLLMGTALYPPPMPPALA